jgi:chemotaxis protein methyltransferase CheR
LHFWNTIFYRCLFQKKKSHNRELRIWSAACAAGQEAYSIAILCDEISKKQKSDVHFRIFATDKSETELQKAQEGVYAADAMKKVTLERFKKYFSSKGEMYAVNSQIRNYIDFSTFDLLGEESLCPPTSIFGGFDIVICANLLFYYKPEFQKHILDKADNCLAKKGWLIVGDAEKEIAENFTSCKSYKNFPLLQKFD